MFGLLDRLHHTADGLDGLPAWFLRLAAPAFAYPLAYLVNLSINSAIIPEQWKRPSLGRWLRYLIQLSPQTVGLYLLSRFCP